MAGPGRDAPVGGQAVLEGVMMRGVRTWSVAVRAPTAAQLERGERMIPEGEIEVARSRSPRRCAATACCACRCCAASSRSAARWRSACER